jgi:azurin
MKKISSLLASLLTLAFAGATALAGTDVINISAFDTMKYSVTTIQVKSGDTVTVNLKNEGNIPKAAMAHNWVLLNAGVSPDAYARLAANAKDHDYQPPALAGKVIATIPLLGPQESGKTTFTAPAPGTYPFLCSFPAHEMAGMKGALIVK